jgi:hypothetical protein
LGLDSTFIEAGLRPIVRVFILVILFVPIGRNAVALPIINVVATHGNFIVCHSLGFFDKICVGFVINFLGWGN